MCVGWRELRMRIPHEDEDRMRKVKPEDPHPHEENGRALGWWEYGLGVLSTRVGVTYGAQNRQNVNYYIS